MADDSTSQNLPQDNQTVPASRSDQLQTPAEATPSSSFGQLQNEWPNSSNLANTPNPADSPSSNLANDPQATSSAEPVVLEPPLEETPPQAPSSEIGQVTETQPETTWPDSTKMANEGSADSSNLANPTSPTDQPVVSTDSPTTSIPSITPTEPASSIPAESPPLSTSPSSPPNISPSVPTPEIPTPLITTTKPSEAEKPPKEKVDTNVQLPDNQATIEQQETLKDNPTVDTEKTVDQLASFKPEPPEQPQEAPLANLSAETLVKEDQDVTDSSQKSFGDLLSSENQPPPAPSIPSIPPIPSTPAAPSVPSVPSSPSISFGDLIKDLKPEESVIPPPPIPSEPAVSSSPPTQNPPSTPPTSSPTISPIPNLPPIANIPPISQSPSDQLSLRRQKANQVRSQKKAKHLSKIMELTKSTKSISNTDIQRLLRVSQSTATNYLSELSKKGLLKKQGIRGGAKYSL